MIPIEIILEIFKYLDISGQTRLALSSSFFFNVLPIKDTNLQGTLRSGDIFVFRYFKLKTPEKFRRYIRDPLLIHRNVEYSNYSAINFLLKNNCEVQPRTLNFTCLYEDFRLFKKLIKFTEPNSKTLDLVCRVGNLQMLDFLFKYGEIFTKKHLQIAVINNHLNIVKYLVNNGVPCNYDIANLAYINNKKEIQQFLLESKNLKPSSPNYIRKHMNKYIINQ